MDNNALLSVRELKTWYEIRKWGLILAGHVRAVDGVSFDLRHGEAIALVGESGCGKSTLAKTMVGLEPPTGGKVRFDGELLDGKGKPDLRRYRSKVGFVQQDPYGALPPFMTVGRALLEPMIINRVGKGQERRQRIREVLQEVKMTPVEDFLNKYPHMLSGGQQQRIVIARAMVLEPKLLVADEPVSMLDASVRVEILEVMRKIQKSHDLGVLYITHDLSTVRYFSEHAFVMYAAKLVEKAEVKELVHNPLHPYAQALLEAIPDPKAENAHVMKDVPTGEPPSLMHPPAGCRFHPRCPHIIEGTCDVDEPPAFEPRPGHLVECWLYRDGGDGDGETA